MTHFVAQCHRRSPWLTRAAVAHFLLLALLLAIMPFDERQVTGVNIWLKPSKFALSIGVYLLTMAWLLGELRRPRWLIGAVAAVVLVSMCMEQFLITLQAARETTSHYNAATAFDSIVFSLMGFGVATNSSAAGFTLLLFLLHGEGQRPAYFWGIRLGLVIFLLGSVQGFAMIQHGGHTVGGSDGGPGIPILAWSKVAGDLRIAHFVGIHAIQVLPVTGFVLDRLIVSAPVRRLLIVAMALGYAGLGLWAYTVAMAGTSWFFW